MDLDTDDKLKIILISGHMSVIDQPKIELADSKYILTYGKIGESNLNSDFAKLEREFFNDELPRNIDEFKQKLPTLQTSDKQFKLHNQNYHDRSITLCSYVFVKVRDDGKVEPCNTEEEASYIVIHFSGTFQMGFLPSYFNDNIYRVNENYADNAIQIYPKVTPSGKKKFMVMRYQMDRLYKGSLYPNKNFINNLFNNKKEIAFQILVDATKIKLSTLISMFTRNSQKTLFIIDGCNDYYGASYEDRLASSASENSGSSIESEHMLASENSGSSIESEDMLAFSEPTLQIQPTIKPKPEKRKNTFTKKGSRTTGKIGDSLANLPQRRSRTTGKQGDSLLNLGLNPNAKGTRKRKRKRKYNRK